MARREGRPRLIINADDFGRSSSINEAIIRAHQEGILTTASLMVTGPAAEEAISLAHQNPSLGVGLHLTLVAGHAALPPGELPGLVNQDGNFTDNAPWAGLRYWAFPGLRKELDAEVEAQVRRFHATGLSLDHVNGHLHLHLHPVVNEILCRHHKEWRIRHMRFTRDPFLLSCRTIRGRWLYRLSHSVIFSLLSEASRRKWDRLGIRHTKRTFGLMADGLVTEDYLLRLLPLLPAGDLELYSHPSLDTFLHEFEALVSPRVRHAMEVLGIERLRYQDL